MTRGRRPAAVTDAVTAPEPQEARAQEHEPEQAGADRSDVSGGGTSRPSGTARPTEPGAAARLRSTASGALRAALARPLLTAVAATAVGLAGLGGAVWMSVEASALRGPAGNSAVIDAETTARLLGDVNAAVERTYGYSFDSLDADERAAQDVVVGAFADRFRQEFATVRELAPAQQAIVTATVRDSAAQSLRGDRAEVLVFVDQTIRNLELPDGASSGARLVVTAELVEGRWRIAEVLSQ